MGVYTATKEFVQRSNGVGMIRRRGDFVQIETRDEAERLLADGSVLPGRHSLKEPVTRDTAQSDAYRKAIGDLAKLGGLPFNACEAMVKRLTKPDLVTGDEMSLDEAIARIKERFGVTDEIEKIMLLASDLGVSQVKANELVASVREIDGCSIEDAVARVREGEFEAINPEAEGEPEEHEPEQIDDPDQGNNPSVEIRKDDRVIAVVGNELKAGVVVKVAEDDLHVKFDGEKKATVVKKSDVELDTEEN